MDKFQIGQEVLARPLNGDFNNEFVGSIISIERGFYQVEDQEGDVFDCEESQLSVPDQLSVEDYVCGGGNKCPACKSEDITGSGVDVDSGYATQESSCDSCSATWTDHYKLVSYTNLQR